MAGQYCLFSASSPVSRRCQHAFVARTFFAMTDAPPLAFAVVKLRQFRNETGLAWRQFLLLPTIFDALSSSRRAAQLPQNVAMDLRCRDEHPADKMLPAPPKVSAANPRER
jgi:hypothetical protein